MAEDRNIKTRAAAKRGTDDAVDTSLNILGRLNPLKPVENLAFWLVIVAFGIGTTFALGGILGIFNRNPLPSGAPTAMKAGHYFTSNVTPIFTGVITTAGTATDMGVRNVLFSPQQGQYAPVPTGYQPYQPYGYQQDPRNAPPVQQWMGAPTQQIQYQSQP